MKSVRFGKVLMVKEPQAINIYKRQGSSIESYFIYDNGVRYYERYDHEDDFECFDSWRGLMETYGH